MAFQAAMSGASALKTLTPTSCGISLNIFANIPYETMFEHFLKAAKALALTIRSIGPLYLLYDGLGRLYKA
jgi:hypothetical protein